MTLCRSQLLLMLFWILANSGCTIKSSQLGSKDRPIVFAVVPGQDRGILEDEGFKLEQELEKETGLHFSVLIPTSFVAVVESLGSARADLAIMNTFGYLLASKKHQARVRLRCTLGGKDQYFGQIITKDAKIKSFKDLQGKTFAFVDPASTSGYVLPTKLLNEHQVKLKEFIFAGTHDSVVRMVYQGRVDAGATYFNDPIGGEPQDARSLVKNQYPDVYSVVRIVSQTDSIPSDPIVFRKELPSEIENKIVLALKEIAKKSEGKRIFKRLYNFDDFIDSSDSDFKEIRATVEAMKLKLDK